MFVGDDPPTSVRFHNITKRGRPDRAAARACLFLYTPFFSKKKKSARARTTTKIDVFPGLISLLLLLLHLCESSHFLLHFFSSLLYSSFSPFYNLVNLYPFRIKSSFFEIYSFFLFFSLSLLPRCEWERNRQAMRRSSIYGRAGRVSFSCFPAMTAKMK